MKIPGSLGDGVDVEDAFHFLEGRSLGGENLADDLRNRILARQLFVDLHPKIGVIGHEIGAQLLEATVTQPARHLDNHGF